MADNAEKTQHLRRCSMHSICQPQGSLRYRLPTLAIKNATPTALKYVFCNTIDRNM